MFFTYEAKARLTFPPSNAQPQPPVTTRRASGLSRRAEPSRGQGPARPPLVPCPAVPRSFSFSPPSARPQPPPGHLGHFGDPLLPGCRRRHLVVPSRPAPRRPRPAPAPAPRAAPPRAVAGVTAARPGSARHGRWPPQGPLRASPGGAVPVCQDPLALRCHRPELCFGPSAPSSPGAAVKARPFPSPALQARGCSVWGDRRWALLGQVACKYRYVNKCKSDLCPVKDISCVACRRHAGGVIVYVIPACAL